MPVVKVGRRGWRSECGRKSCQWSSRAYIDRYAARAALSEHLDYEHRSKSWLAPRSDNDLGTDADVLPGAEADAGGGREAASTATDPNGQSYAPRHLVAGGN